MSMTSWREVINAEGQTYYYDEINKESTWDKPAVYKRADEVSDGEREENAEGQEEEEEVGEAPRWCRAFDEAQEVYYYHTGTNEVTRARPEGFIDDDEGVNEGYALEEGAYNDRGDVTSEGIAGDSMEGSGRTQEEEVDEAPRWCRAFDEAQEVYYYHTGTNEVTRARPEGFIDDDEGVNEGYALEEGAYNDRGDVTSEGIAGDSMEGSGRTQEEEVGEAPRWCRAFDEAQEVYYYHTGTNEVTRARPEGFIDDDEGVNEGYAIEEATYDDRGDAASEDGEVADEADGSIEGSENMVAGVAAAAPTSADTLKPTTTEAASPPAAPVVDPLALAIAKLDEPDAIMELDVADTNMKAMQLGGDPAEMISKLFEGYQVSSSLVVAGFNLKFI